MSKNLAFIISINAAKLRLLLELEGIKEKTTIFGRPFDGLRNLCQTKSEGCLSLSMAPFQQFNNQQIEDSTKLIQQMSIKEAQTAVDEWIKTYGVRYFSELTNMALLTEEVGELARIIARTYGDQSFKESDRNRNMADEMADILWVLLCLANQTGVDLTEAFAKNMEKKTVRDRERHIHNDKLRDPIA